MPSDCFWLSIELYILADILYNILTISPDEGVLEKNQTSLIECSCSGLKANRRTKQCAKHEVKLEHTFQIWLFN